MKPITALFIVVGIALGIYVFKGQDSVSEMVQDEVSRGAAAPMRSEQPL